MNKRLIIAALFTLLASCWGSVAVAGERQYEDIPNTLVMGSPPKGWPPFSIVGEHPHPHKGIMIDVIKEITARLGYNLKFAFFPEKRNRMMLAEGKIHAYAKAMEWVEDPSVFLWSDPIVTSVDILISRANAPVQFTSIHELARRSIGSVYGFSYPALDEAFASGTIHHHTSKDTESILRMVQRGHIDGAVTNRHVAEWIIRNQPDMTLSEFVFSSTPIGSAPYRFAFCNTPKWMRFLADFNRELASMKEDGRLQSILERYK